MNNLTININRTNPIIYKITLLIFTLAIISCLNNYQPNDKNSYSTFTYNEQNANDTIKKEYQAVDTLKEKITEINDKIIRKEKINDIIEDIKKISKKNEALNTKIQAYKSEGGIIKTKVLFSSYISEIEEFSKEKNALDSIINGEQAKDTLNKKSKEIDEKIKRKEKINDIIEEIKKVNNHETNINNQIKELNIPEINIKTIQNKKLDKTLIEQLRKAQLSFDSEIIKIQSEIKKFINKNSGHLSFQFQYKNDSYSCFILNTKSTQHELRLHLKNNEGKYYQNFSNLNKRIQSDSTDVLMLMNGGMYLPDMSPQGLFIDNGKKIKNIDTIKQNNNTNFYMFPNGVFTLDTNNNPKILITDTFLKAIKEEDIKYATQSGPMLLINGKIHEKFTKGSKNINIRNGVGIPLDSTHNVLFIISNNRVNFYDFASVYKDLFNCKDALYLDGAISDMYIKGIHKYISPNGYFGPLISITEKKSNK